MPIYLIYSNLFLALTSRPSVHSNPYVSIPYATASSLDLEWQNKEKDGPTGKSSSKKRKGKYAIRELLIISLRNVIGVQYCY